MTRLATATAAAADGAPVQLNGSHSVTRFLQKLIQAPANARIAMAIGELATSLDAAVGSEPLALAVSSIDSDDRAGQTAAGLAALWGRWGRPAVLVDLGSGSQSVAGAIGATSPDLDAAADMVGDEPLTEIARLHASLPRTGVIAAGSADVLGLVSTGRLGALIECLKRNHERIVLVAPSLSTGFPFLPLATVADRLVLALERGKTRGAPVREVAEQALHQGLRPIEAIWFD